jgi:predicted nucleic acid-binding protein
VQDIRPLNFYESNQRRGVGYSYHRPSTFLSVRRSSFASSADQVGRPSRQAASTCPICFYNRADLLLCPEKERCLLALTDPSQDHYPKNSTNIFLEILLQRGNRRAAKNIFTANPPTDLFVTDFSLYSIGVFLFQRNWQDIYERFVTDMIIKTEIGVIGLNAEDAVILGRASKQFNLDFDDAYQYAVADKYRFQIVSFDSDFDRTEKGRKVPG